MQHLSQSLCIIATVYVCWKVFGLLNRATASVIVKATHDNACGCQSVAKLMNINL